MNVLSTSRWLATLLVAASIAHAQTVSTSGFKTSKPSSAPPKDTGKLAIIGEAQKHFDKLAMNAEGILLADGLVVAKITKTSRLERAPGINPGQIGGAIIRYSGKFVGKISPDGKGVNGANGGPIALGWLQSLIPNQKTPGAYEPQNLVTTFTEAASGNVGDVAGVGDTVTIYVNQKNPDAGIYYVPANTPAQIAVDYFLENPLKRPLEFDVVLLVSPNQKTERRTAPPGHSGPYQTIVGTVMPTPAGLQIETAVVAQPREPNIKARKPQKRKSTIRIR